MRLCNLRAVYIGGNANNGSNAGFVCTNTNNAASNANTNIGSRLSYKVMDCRPCPLAKDNLVKIGAGSTVESS